MAMDFARNMQKNMRDDVVFLWVAWIFCRFLAIFSKWHRS